VTPLERAEAEAAAFVDLPLEAARAEADHWYSLEDVIAEGGRQHRGTGRFGGVLSPVTKPAESSGARI